VATKSVVDVIDSINQQLYKQFVDIRNETINSKTFVPAGWGKNNLYELIVNRVSTYCLNEIHSQYLKTLNVDDYKPCSNSFRSNYSMPCYHTLL
jgi:hypothetical protein